MKELLQELVAVVYELQQKTEMNWSVEFSGHVNSVSVFFTKTVRKGCKCCGQKKDEYTWLSHQTYLDDTKAPIKKLIEKCKSYLPEGN